MLGMGDRTSMTLEEAHEILAHPGEHSLALCMVAAEIIDTNGWWDRFGDDELHSSDQSSG